MKIDEIFATDKLLHLSAGFVLTILLSAVFTATGVKYPISLGLLITFIILIGKEVHDIIKRRSWADSFFDLGFGAAGSGLALFCLAGLM